MTYLFDGIALGADFLLFVYCLRHYLRQKHLFECVQSARELDINADMIQVVMNSPNMIVPYICIKGRVTAQGEIIGASSTINLTDNVKGVVQHVVTKEHAHRRTASGFWIDTERTIQHVHNEAPFSLDSNNLSVHIIEPLSANELDMEVTSDIFTPSNYGLVDHVWSYCSGVRQVGVQTTEFMLREGTILTGIGQLAYSTESNLLTLGPPHNGNPYYLIKRPLPTLLEQLHQSTCRYFVCCLLLGLVSAALSGYLSAKYLKARKNSARKKTIDDEERRRRRQQLRIHASLSHQCVVCKSNPLEIILLPCGHVCLCEDCSVAIANKCPVCRSLITSKSAAYIP